MPKNIRNTKPKLSERHKQVLIDMLAGGFDNHEILDFILSEYGIKIASSNVTYYRRHRWEDIQKAREKFRDRMFEITPFASKIARIAERQRLIKNIKKEGLWLDHVDVKGKIKHQKGNHGVINNLLDSIKDEMEPKRSLLVGSEGDDKEWRIIIEEINPSVENPVDNNTSDE